MKTIEKYILKETLFFSTISTIVVSILMILIVFLNSLEETKLDIEQILYTMLYSIFKLGEFSSVILSLGCILGIITVINIMNKNFEIITIKNFGISDLQILKPFLITGTIFSLIALLFSFYISPYMLSKAKIILYTNIKKEEGLKRLNPVDSWIKNENFICNIFYYDTTRNSAFGLKCIEIKDKITGYITIDRADWIDGWIAKNVRMWDDKSKEIKKLTSLNEINHILPKPKYLSKQFKDIEELNLKELLSTLRALKISKIKSNKLIMVLLARLFDPLLIVSLTFIILPFTTEKPRERKTFTNITLGLATTILSFIIFRTISFFGENDLLGPKLAFVVYILLLIAPAYVVYKLRYNRI